jgi:DNA-binding transcriptional LysR family regulator
MDDFNDLYYFVSVVLYHGFSAAARTIGVEKTRLSRRIADLERRLGVRLLQRSTRNLTLTEAGEHFYARCVAAVERANTAYESVAELKKEACGTVRLASPPALAQNYLAPIVPGYLALHPKVSLSIEATDRDVNLIEERFDMVLRAEPLAGDGGGLVVRHLGNARRILVAAPAWAARDALPDAPQDLARLATIGMPGDGKARWVLSGPASASATVEHAPRPISNDLRIQLDAAIGGIGIALLPEPMVAAALDDGRLIQLLPEWSGATHGIHLVYPSPRGMLPSVRSLIDYLSRHLPGSIGDGATAAGPSA